MKYTALLLITVAFVYSLVNIFTKDSIYEYSDEFIEEYQSSRTGFLTGFFKGFSFLMEETVIIGIIVLFYPFLSLESSFRLNLLFAVGFNLSNTLKLAFRDPRPFMTNTRIDNLACEGGYGNPSGHALMSFTFYPYAAYLLGSSGNKRTVLLCLAYLVCSLIAWSRVYLGVHSIDQIVYGSVLGICLSGAFMLEFASYDSLFALAKTLKKCIFTVIAFLFPILLNVLLYFTLPTPKNQSSWEKTLFDRCPKKKEKYNFAEKTLTDSFFNVWIITVLISLHFLLKIRSTLALQEWTRMRFSKKIAIVALIMLVLLAIVVPFEFVGLSKLLSLLLKKLLPMIILSILCFYVTPRQVLEEPSQV